METAMAGRIALTVSLMALVTLLSLMPGNATSTSHALGRLLVRTPVHFQKIMHVCLYAVLSFLLVWTLDPVHVVAYRYLLAFGIAAGFGSLIEWCQTKVPGRFGTVADVGLNAAGAALGLLAATLLLRT